MKCFNKIILLFTIVFTICSGHAQVWEPTKRQDEQQRLDSIARVNEQKRQQEERDRLAREQEQRRQQADRDRIAREQEEKRQQADRDRIAREKEEKQQQADRDRIAQILNIEMVFVQGGTFTMGCTSEQGSDCNNDEKPAHKVTVSDFYIGKYEVTQAQWQVVMGNNPSQFKGDNLPVDSVNWFDVQEFIKCLNARTGKQYRLPTEAEWEFAARGGKSSRGYKYSGSNNISDVAWFDENSGKKPHPVGTKSPNELGLYDMSGNVWEWCSDWYGFYDNIMQTNPQGTSSGSKRVGHSGSWNYNARGARVSSRGVDEPGNRCNDVGFRLACNSK